VTFCFGFNDWDSGMRGPQFRASYEDAIERVRRATQGKAEILILSTVPSLERWSTMTELSEACRAAAQAKNAGLADTEKAFLEAGKEKRERLFCRDRTHLGPAGHELAAQTVLEAIERSGK
jgi:lysophospholipase L1-like esterase